MAEALIRYRITPRYAIQILDTVNDAIPAFGEAVNLPMPTLTGELNHDKISRLKANLMQWGWLKRDGRLTYKGEKAWQQWHKKEQV